MQLDSITCLSSRLKSYTAKAITTAGLVVLLVACGEKTAEDHYQEAVEFTASGNQSAAVVALKNAVQLEPNLAKARFALGNIHLSLSDFDSASKELTFALEAGHAENEIIPLLTKALDRSNSNVALAELSYQEALLTPQEQVEAGYRVAQALIALTKEDETKELIEHLLTIDTTSIYKTMTKALQQAIDNEFASALETSKLALQTDSTNRDAIDLTARFYLLNNDPQNAAKLYEDYIKVAPDDLEAKFALANMLLEQQQTQRAEKYIDELLSINANNPTLNQLKSVVRAADEDYENAKKFSEKSIGLGNNSLNARMVAGLASFKLEEYEAALNHLSIVASSLPDNHPALRMLAASQLELNMGEDAGEVLLRISDVTQEDLTLFSRAGYELIKSGNTEAAQQLIEQTEQYNESADDLAKLGVLKLSLNNLEGIIDLEGAVAKAPKSVNVKNTLADAYLNTNQLEKALAFAQGWQQQDPSSIDGLMLEAEVRQRQDNFKEAAKLIEKASTIDSTNPTVQLGAIRLSMRQERYDEGLILVEKFLEEYPTNASGLANYLRITAKLGDPAPAIARIEAEAAKNTDNEALLLLASRTMVGTNRFNEALTLLADFTPNKLTARTYWDTKGTALLRTNQVDKAYAHYAQWVNFYPRQESPTIGLLRILDAQSKFAEGAAIAADFNAQNSNVRTSIMQAYFLAMLTDVNGSKEILNDLGEQYQSVPFVRGVRARIALMEGRGSQGIEDAKASYEQSKTANNLLVYVQTLDSTGSRDASLALIEKHVNAYPDDARGRALLAERKISTDPGAALSLYEEMISEFPNNPVLLNNAAYLLMEAKDLEKAFQYSTRAIGISNQNVDFADTYGQIQIRRGEAEEAAAAYNAVITEAVTDETIILNYIEAMLLNKDNAAARRKIQEFNSKIKSKEGRARLLVLQATYMN